MCPPEPTPEERLLRLIRDKSAASSGEASIPSSGPAPEAVFRYDVLTHKPDEVRRLKNRWVSRLLVTACCVAAGFALHEAVFKPEASFRLPVPSGAREGIVAATSSEDVRSDPQALLGSFAGRDLFQPSFARREEDAPVIPEKTVFLKDLAGSLSLMGVVEGSPYQAIIADSQTQKTYFLNEGDYLGEIRIQKVRSGLVTLEYDGEQLDLRL